jgi:tetratricopeptide (TPR) repeat protein
LDFTNAIELRPDYAEAYLARGISKGLNGDWDPKHLYHNGDFDGAIEDFTAAIRLRPDYAKAYYLRGDAREHKGDIDGGIADYTKAIGLNPDSNGAPGLYLGRARMKQTKGDMDGAIADYTKQLELKRDSALAVILAYPAYIARASARTSKGDLDGAIADCTAAIELHPNFSDGYYCRARAREAKRDVDGANADYGRANHLNPTSAADYSKQFAISPITRSSAAALVMNYLAAAGTLDSSATRAFLSANCKGDMLTEFRANGGSGWSFSGTDTGIISEATTAEGGSAVVAEVVFRGGSPPTYMSTRHTFFLALENGSWKISRIDPAPRTSGPGFMPLGRN